ncbi:hypothetical protein TNCT_349261 [Trichonephila clavata]|uniref:Uncharacterized protein n=1 Tax=Trichonephila clavata TaxID=2740835 RepID=A0A8X6FIN6_TRICU|nr:hypothetical protein TNCT_349261 [Trichonephila clavata]
MGRSWPHPWQFRSQKDQEKSKCLWDECYYREAGWPHFPLLPPALGRRRRGGLDWPTFEAFTISRPSCRVECSLMHSACRSFCLMFSLICHSTTSA